MSANFLKHSQQLRLCLALQMLDGSLDQAFFEKHILQNSGIGIVCMCRYPIFEVYWFSVEEELSL